MNDHHLTAAKRMTNKRKQFIQGPRSAWDTVEIDHLPVDHWMRKRATFVFMMNELQHLQQYARLENNGSGGEFDGLFACRQLRTARS